MGETALCTLSVSSLSDQFWFIKRPNNLVAENYQVDQTLSSKYFLQRTGKAVPLTLFMSHSL